MMKNRLKSWRGGVVTIALAMLAVVVSAAAPSSQCVIEEGDLLFVLAAGNDPIVAATVRDGRLNANHVGIAHRDDDGRLAVVEARPARGVVITPVDSFMARARDRVVVKRLVDTCGVAAMVSRAMTYVGRPYDDLFMLDEQEVYCSELVWLSYVRPDGRRVFDLVPMSFHDVEGNILDFWTKYYASRGIRVPAGAPGTNPSQLSTSTQLTTVFLPSGHHP